MQIPEIPYLLLTVVLTVVGVGILFGLLIWMTRTKKVVVFSTPLVTPLPAPTSTLPPVVPPVAPAVAPPVAATAPTPPPVSPPVPPKGRGFGRRLLGIMGWAVLIALFAVAAWLAWQRWGSEFMAWVSSLMGPRATPSGGTTAPLPSTTTPPPTIERRSLPDVSAWFQNVVEWVQNLDWEAMLPFIYLVGAILLAFLVLHFIVRALSSRLVQGLLVVTTITILGALAFAWISNQNFSDRLSTKGLIVLHGHETVVALAGDWRRVPVPPKHCVKFNPIEKIELRRDGTPNNSTFVDVRSLVGEIMLTIYKKRGRC